MTSEVLTGGVASAALLSHAASGQEYLAEIALGLLGKLSDADLLAEVRSLETQQRAMQVAWPGLVAELEQRGLPARAGAGATNTSALLRGVLQLSPHEASARVKAAAVLGPRVSLDGQTLEPLLPAVAAAQREGRLSAEHAKVIAAALAQVPSTVPVEQFAQAEQHLVEAAKSLPPRQVGDVGKRVLAYLDPDGVLSSDAEHERRREFTLTALSDGSYRANGYVTPTCGAQLLAVLDAHAAPTPAEDGTRDPRTHSQRMHDALETLTTFVVRRGELLHGDGVTQLVIAMTANDLATGQGLAETSFGQLISIPDALQLADEAALAIIIKDAHGAVLAEGRSKRCATRAHTLALISRDKRPQLPRVVTGHPTGARDTTSSPGSTTDSPMPTTSPCSAATTTETSTKPAGTAPCVELSWLTKQQRCASAPSPANHPGYGGTTPENGQKRNRFARQYQGVLLVKFRNSATTKIGLLAAVAVLTVVLLADCSGSSGNSNAQSTQSIPGLDATDTTTDNPTDTMSNTDSATDSSTTPASASTTPTSVQPSKTAPRSSFSPPPGSLAACALPYLQVSVTHASGGDSHQGAVLLFRNTGQIACAMTGYPGAALLDAQGKQVKQAARTPSGYLGGMRKGKPTTIPLYSGQTASALLEGEVVDINGKTCPTTPAILVTPPNTTTSAKLKITTEMCGGTQIHPVVTGTSGSST